MLRDLNPCFVLYDPVDAAARLLHQPQAHWLADAPAQAGQTPQWLEQQLRQGRQIAMFAGFGAADALAGLQARQLAGSPRVEALGFDRQVERADDAAVDAWLLQRLAAETTHGGDAAAAAPAGLAGWRSSLPRRAYEHALKDVLGRIAAGETYQVNLTFALQARVFGHPIALYRALRRAQPTAYRVLARLRDRWVLSLSPERFFRLDENGGIEVRPMKGTAPRHADPQRDAEAGAWLRQDPKNRAENLMILDLLRNDLGRLARPGSVHVPQRFVSEPYATVWQMTSTVRAQLRDDVDWSGLWRALFPCGSVVGAPKHRTMQIIAELESAGRGLYTGAIGWLRPQPDARPAATPSATRGEFSVAIRTLEIDAATHGPTRRARLGVGGGVVADSTPAGEWRECWLKARFATSLDPGFGLIETFAAHYPTQRERIEPHLRRLARSARYFGFALDRRALLRALEHAHASAADDAHGDAPAPASAPTAWRRRTRIELRHDGSFDIRCAPLATSPARVDVLLAEQVVADAMLDSRDPLLRHKTTHRERYDRAWQACERMGAFDALFFNERGELCEGARSSVFVRLQGRWWTPPVRCGLLPGVARAALLADPALGACERVLRREDLLQAQALMLSNGLRGTLAARLRLDGARASDQNGAGRPMP